MGQVRSHSDVPLLDLDVAGVEALDEKLLARAKVLRVVLKMLYRANKRPDLDDALPRQRRAAKRHKALDEVLMPDDVLALIAKAGNLRDRALLAVIASTGGRIGKILNLRLRDIKQSNGGFQVWFGETKAKSDTLRKLRERGRNTWMNG